MKQKILFLMLLTWLSLSSLLLPPTVQAAEFCNDAYYIDVSLPNLARWEMCWEHRNFNGVSLHHVYYTPRNGQRRLVFYQAELAQVHVPYDDNGARYHDITDYGFGGRYLAALTQDECPDGQLLGYAGKFFICQQMVSRGEAYRDIDEQVTGHSLSLFSVSQIGAYNYIPRWQFSDDGSMEFGVGATGALQRFSDNAPASPGWLIAQDKVGISHAHSFFWRLDFDLGGNKTDDYVEELNFINENGKLVKQSKRFSRETASSVNPATSRTWIISSENLENSQGQPGGYEIQLNQSGQRDTGPVTEPFTRNDIYVTKEKSCELYASHNKPITNEDEGCADNLASFVNGESIDRQDIVVWPTVTFYHMPRSEDIPNMDAHWSSFRLIPTHWHDNNPLAEVGNSTP